MDDTTGLSTRTVAAAVRGQRPGKTVVVTAGTYSETVVVERAVTLRASGRVVFVGAPFFDVRAGATLTVSGAHFVTPVGESALRVAGRARLEGCTWSAAASQPLVELALPLLPRQISAAWGGAVELGHLGENHRCSLRTPEGHCTFEVHRSACADHPELHCALAPAAAGAAAAAATTPLLAVVLYHGRLEVEGSAPAALPPKKAPKPPSPPPPLQATLRFRGRGPAELRRL